MADKTQFKGQNNITIIDVANALGISKTTVSRAISGKGRIGDATRKRVMEYIRANNYSPSMAAKGLANSKTYNIGWVMPGDSDVTELPFFHSSLIGITETAREYNYDVLVVMVFENDISQLERVIQSKKVDGLIVGRTLIKDPCVELLQKNDIPYVVIGSTPNDNIIQIDENHVEACCELTVTLLKKGIKKIALLGGNSNFVVNQKRVQGFKEAFLKEKIPFDEKMFYMGLTTRALVEQTLKKVLKQNPDCIVSTDDWICAIILGILRKIGINVPGDIKIASFYNNMTLDLNKPPVTAIQFYPKELGMVACRQILDYLSGQKINVKTFLPYKILLRDST